MGKPRNGCMCPYGLALMSVAGSDCSPVLRSNAPDPSKLADSGHRPRPPIPADGTIPNEVVQLVIGNDWSIIRAWREYLAITRVEMANRLGIHQPTYARMEALDARHRRSTRARVAAAMGLHFDQLDV